MLNELSCFIRFLTINGISYWDRFIHCATSFRLFSRDLLNGSSALDCIGNNSSSHPCYAINHRLFFFNTLRKASQRVLYENDVPETKYIYIRALIQVTEMFLYKGINLELGYRFCVD